MKLGKQESSTHSHFIAPQFTNPPLPPHLPYTPLDLGSLTSIPPPPPPDQPPIPIPIPLLGSSPGAPLFVPQNPHMSSAPSTFPFQSPPTTASPQASMTGTTISRPPILNRLPSPPAELASDEALLEIQQNDQQQGSDEQRSLRPGQAKFAERLMAKYGWTKGSGLGASGTGILNPVQMKTESIRRRTDSESGRPGPRVAMGRIIAPKTGRSKQADEDGYQDQDDDKMSEVIVLKGMLKGLDIDAEMVSDTGGLMQEIGEECGEKYGRVERVLIRRSDAAMTFASSIQDDDALVYVKFTSSLSALRVSSFLMLLA
jgi:splicing factor 45